MMTRYRIEGSTRHDPGRLYYTRASATPVHTLAKLLADKHNVHRSQIVIVVAEVAA